MRRKLFFFGIVLMLGGVTFLAVISNLKDVQKISISNSSGAWEISANLTERNTYIIDILASSSWKDDFSKGGYTEEQPVDAVLISPDGGKTELQGFFLARLSTSEWVPGTFPSLIYVEYKTIDHNNIEVDEHYPQIRFTVMHGHGGFYTLRIIEDTLTWTSAPPREIIFYKEVINEVDPTYVPIGGIFCFIGLFISITGAKAHEKRMVKKKIRLHH